MAVTLNALSMMVWGLVAAKAKAGMQAASSDDHTTVKQMLKKATNLILMVVFASFVKFGAEMSQKQNTIGSRHPTLKAIRTPTTEFTQATNFMEIGDSASPWEEKEHTPSFYDPTSSHYMGGAHNVALAHLSNPNSAMLTGVPEATPVKSFNAQQTAYEALIEGRTDFGEANPVPMVGANNGSVLNYLGGVYRNGQGSNLNRQIKSQV